MNNSNARNNISGFLYFIFAVCTAMIGYTIHSSVFWAIIDFFFVPFAWFKWLICKQITLAIIKTTFAFFFV
jgi:hypothetical protein